MKGLMIAAPSSGSGKTLITLSLLRILKNSGYKIAPFKSGPDYIDPMFHKSASGCDSNNLDSYLISDDKLKEIFSKNCQGKDIALIEGVMGYYDGYNYTTKASSYYLAKLLKMPVILVIDAKGVSNTIISILRGIITYRDDSNICGVILNNISHKHYLKLKEIIEDECRIKCFGFIPKLKTTFLKDRHLGLIQTNEIKEINNKIDDLANTIKKNIDVDSIIRKCNFTLEKNDFKQNKISIHNKAKVAVAYDQAFSFYYNENLKYLEESNVEITYFSPIKDSSLPNNISGLYLGGGYPELYLKELSNNQPLLNEIKERLNNGLPCYGECGGLIYLTRGFREQNTFPLVNFFDIDAEMTNRLQRFGYVEVKYDQMIVKAHEFHYSRIINNNKNDFTFKYEVSKGNQKWQCGYSKNNVLAAYQHIHFHSNTDFSNRIIKLLKGKIDAI